MPAKKKPRKVFLGRLDYCSTYYQQNKLIRELSGEVVEYNMLDEIKNVRSVEEIMGMPKEDARKYVMLVRTKHKMKDLVKHWGVHDSFIYKEFLPSLEISTAGRGRSRYTIRDNNNNKVTANVVAATPAAPVMPIINAKPVTLNQNSFSIKLVGVVKGKELLDRTLNITSILNESIEYDIKFNVDEEANEDNNVNFNFIFNGVFNGKALQEKLLNIQGIIIEGNTYKMNLVINEH